MASAEFVRTDIDYLEFADGELPNRDRDVVIGMKRLRLARQVKDRISVLGIRSRSRS